MKNKSPVPRHLRKFGFSAERARDISKKCAKIDYAQYSKWRLIFEIMNRIQYAASCGEYSARLDNQGGLLSLERDWGFFSEEEKEEFFPGIKFSTANVGSSKDFLLIVRWSEE